MKKHPDRVFFQVRRLSDNELELYPQRMWERFTTATRDEYKKVARFHIKYKKSKP